MLNLVLRPSEGNCTVPRVLKKVEREKMFLRG